MGGDLALLDLLFPSLHLWVGRWAVCTGPCSFPSPMAGQVGKICVSFGGSNTGGEFMVCVAGLANIGAPGRPELSGGAHGSGPDP